MAQGKGRNAVLVLPDMGLAEHHLDRLKSEFQNHLVASLKGVGADDGDTVVVVVVVVYTRPEREE